MTQIEKAFKEDMKNHNRQTVSNPVEAVVSDDLVVTKGFGLILVWNAEKFKNNARLINWRDKKC